MQSWTIVSAAGVLLAGWAATAGNPLIGLSGAVFLALAALLSRRRWLMLPALFLLGLAYGAQWSRALLEQRLSPSYESLPLAARVTVLEPPQLRTYSAGGQRQRFVADVVLLHCPDAAPGCNPRIGKVLLAWYGRELLRVGDVVRAEVMLRRPRGLSNPGSFNFEAWLARHRYVATGHMRGAGFLRLDAGKAWFYQRWRQALKERLHNQAMDNRVRGVLLALTTGDRSGFDGAFWQTLQRFGLNHLVVVSGLHVGLVAGIGFLLGRLFSRRGAHLAAAA